MNATISVDWLQMHVKVPYINYETIGHTKYQVEKQPYQTRHFKRIYTILQGGEEVATLVSEPHSSIMQFDSGLLKINNKFLYQADLMEWVKQLLKDLELEFRSISRIDLAVDFQKFARGLRPEQFIRNFMNDKYLKVGKAKGRASFVTTAKGKDYETLKFGSEQSDITYYLYNKSKEMREVKLKPWIEDNWYANGWDGKTDVWRLEFSLKSNTKAVVDPDTGQEIFSFKDIDVMTRIQEVYNYNFTKYFSFVHTEKKCRKDRMKPVLLFSGRKYECVKINLSDKKDSTRSSKVFAKALMTVNQELRGHDFELAIFGSEYLSWYIQERNLQKWASQKLQGFEMNEKQASKGFAKKVYEWTLLSVASQHREKILAKQMNELRYSVLINRV